MVEATVYDTSKQTTTTETRFFISSLPVDPRRALEAIRSHSRAGSMPAHLKRDRARTIQPRFVI